MENYFPMARDALSTAAYLFYAALGKQQGPPSAESIGWR